MGKLSYKDQLKDPRWQKKRLEIMERADFKCEECGNDKDMLHIHHGYYDKNLMLWEYNNNTLHCVCEDCHETFQSSLRGFYKDVGKLNRQELANLHITLNICQDELFEDDIEYVEKIKKTVGIPDRKITNNIYEKGYLAGIKQKKETIRNLMINSENPMRYLRENWDFIVNAMKNDIENNG